MRIQSLSIMVKNLRSEAGHALSIAQGTNQYETLKYLLARTQEELWTAFVWPDLVMRTDMALVAGQYLYDFPTMPTVTFDMIREVLTTSSPDGNWHELAYGIPEEFIKPNTYDNTSRADPVQAWDVAIDGQFRVYPTPNTSGNFIRFKVQQNINPLVADSDKSTLDATCIILFAAADLLARAKAEDASLKMQKAQRHLVKLLGNKISAKNKVSSLGGGMPSMRLRHSNLLYGPGQ